MTPDQAIDMLLHVPYLVAGNSIHGADCFGIVELWYRHVLDIEVDDRAHHPSCHDGLASGFDARINWVETEIPQNHCLVIMRAGRHPAGHIGVFYNGSILHSDASHGCVYEPASGRFIRRRITGYLVRK